MKSKQNKTSHTETSSERHLTLMAVQEKLGLFIRHEVLPQELQEQEFLTKKPLGMI